MRKWESFMNGAFAGVTIVVGLVAIILSTPVSSAGLGLILWCIAADTIKREVRHK